MECILNDLRERKRERVIQRESNKEQQIKRGEGDFRVGERRQRMKKENYNKFHEEKKKEELEKAMEKRRERRTPMGRTLNSGQLGI